MRCQMMFALALAAAACGSHSDSDSSSTAKPEAEHHEHEMESMSPELARFHDVLAPKWHAPPGAARRQGACAAMADFKKRAAEVPNGKDLVAAVDALDNACTTKAADAEIDAAFGKVHEAFHHLLESK